MFLDHHHSRNIAPVIGTAPKLRPGQLLPSSLTHQLSIVVFVVLLAQVSTATTSHATSCLPFPPVIATALCKDGVCSEGFGIDHVSTGYGCGRRPVVRELSEADLGLFAKSARHSYNQRFSGIFAIEVKHFCLGRSLWGEECITPTSIRRLSESVDPLTLDGYRSEGLDTERQAHHSYWRALWIIAAVWHALTILVIGWPWALGAWIPAFRRCLGWTLLVAIPIQLFAGFYFSVSVLLPFGPLPNLLKVSGTICAVAIAVAIPLQLGTYIRRKIRAPASSV